MVYAVGFWMVWVGIVWDNRRRRRGRGMVEARCAGLTAVMLEGAKVTSATLGPVGGDLSMSVKLASELSEKLPAFCRVMVTDTPTGDSILRRRFGCRWRGGMGGIVRMGNGGFAGID